VRLNVGLIHKPAEHRGRTLARVGDQTIGCDVELLSRAIEHGLRRADRGSVNGGRRFDVHDNRAFEIAEVIIVIGVVLCGVPEYAIV